MKVVLFANNRVGWRVAEALRRSGAEVVAAVIHPPERRKYGEEIVAATGLPRDRVLDGSRLGDPELLAKLASLEPDIGVSALFGYLLRPPVLALFRHGCVNVHPSLLPWNRGAHPNVWSIVEGTPAGVTMHHVDEGVDTGDIIAQREVPVEPFDTGQSLYTRLEEACVELFGETWPRIADGTAPRTPQPQESGSTHRARDLALLDEIQLDRTYTGRELIDILRARTFPPHDGAYFTVDGQRVYLRLSLEQRQVKAND